MKPEGIILAGGQSTRMESDKGLVGYRGKPLISYAIDLLDPFCSNIIISANNREYEKFGYPVVYDIVKDAGPAGGLLSALQKSGNDFNLVVSCDMPNLNEEAVELLLKNANGTANCIPVHKHGVEPLFAIYRKNFAEVLSASVAKNVYKMKMILEQFPAMYVDFNPLLCRYPLLFKNINHLADLE